METAMVQTLLYLKQKKKSFDYQSGHSRGQIKSQHPLVPKCLYTGKDWQNYQIIIYQDDRTSLVTLTLRLCWILI